MTVNIAGKTVSVADLLALAGGIVAIVGAPLAWINLSAQGMSEDLGGLDEGLLAGKVALALGILLVVVAGIAILKLVKIPPLALALIELGLGVLVLAVLVLVYFTDILSDHSFQDISDLYKSMGGSASLSVGVIVELVGGLLAVGGGVLALVKKA
jgi:peptidoglycan biosynthesis protein MviN/MurJ (putative lipid II flippase)